MFVELQIAEIALHGVVFRSVGAEGKVGFGAQNVGFVHQSQAFQVGIV